MKRIIIALLTIVLIVTSFTLTVSAASNPYGKWQTIDGVTTVRCTWYAWQQAYDNTGVALPNFGNGGNWYSNAQNAGYAVGSVAKPNSIAVWSGGTYGHVSYVVSVNGSKMTVNEAGMTTNGAAYNGDGIYNGSICNTTVGGVKSQYSSKILVGFIYLTESVTPSVPITITKGYTGAPDSIGETNAVVNGTVTKPASYDATVFGISIRRSDSASWEKNYRHTAQESHDGQTSFRIYFDINAEVGYYLTHATSYTYQFFAVINNTDYYSEEMTFTTSGSHSYGAWQTVTAAGCTSQGTQKRTCACGDTQTQHIPATGHSYGAWQTVTPAGCTTQGSQKRTCACGSVETQSIGALGHSYSSSFTVDTPATCTTAGSKSKHCTRCSATTEVTSIPAKGHSFGSWQTVSSPTCTATGTDKRACSECSYTEYITTTALGHSYSSSWTTDKAATCTTAGTKSHHCTRSNCTAKKDVTTITAKGHSWSDWTVTKNATYEATGTKLRECTANGCSATESAVIAKLSLDGHTHNFSAWVTETAATCTKNGVEKHTCSICKNSETREITAIGHSFGEWAVEKNATCENNGVQKRSCSNCKETETLTSPALGHNFGEWSVKTEATAEKEGVLERTCSTCSKVETQSTPKLDISIDTSSDIVSAESKPQPIPQPNDSDGKLTNTNPTEDSNLSTVIIICSAVVIATLGALIVLVLLRKKK